MEVKKVFKKVALSLFVIVGLIILVYYYTKLFESNKTIHQPGFLSERAKQYLQNQKQDYTNIWNFMFVANKDLQEPVKQLVPKHYNIDNCFTFILNIEPDILRQEDCSVYMSFDNPKGKIRLVYEYPAKYDLDNNPSIIIRRQNPQRYLEEKISTSKNDFLVFTDNYSQNRFEKTVFLSVDGGLLTASFSFNFFDFTNDMINLLNSLSVN
ncbi:MAG: hypothetical protein KatS3mg090_0690 [Patescibacteria group bacterium]|nr:MAG: hypothetical protein KatS3mg090_0690 [Patescibacteria group bacterium]